MGYIYTEKRMEIYKLEIRAILLYTYNYFILYPKGNVEIIYSIFIIRNVYILSFHLSQIASHFDISKRREITEFVSI